MEESNQKQHQDQLYLTQGIVFKPTLDFPTSFKITRQKSFSSLNKKQKTPSPQHANNFKQKHLMYKRDLLQEKFQNLQVKQKEEKKPLKLKLEKVNKENGMLIKQLSDISNEIQIKFQAQNSLIKRSLQKMEKMVSKNIPKQQVSRNASSRKLNLTNERQKIPEIVSPTQNQQKHLIQLQKTIQEKIKLQDQVRNMKSINTFLSNENYKLSMENSMLKTRILEYQQDDYDNALKSIKTISKGNSDISDENKSAKSLQQNERDEANQKIQQNKEGKHKNHIRWQEDQKQSSVKIRLQKQQNSSTMIQQSEGTIKKSVAKSEGILLKQIDTQKFQQPSFQDEGDEAQLISQSNSSRINQKSSGQILTKNIDSNDSDNINKNNTIAGELLKLSRRIKELQEQLQQEKLLNQSLSNKIASLRLQLHQNYKQRKLTNSTNKEKIQSAISIKMDLLKTQQEKSNKSLSQLVQQEPSYQKIPYSQLNRAQVRDIREQTSNRRLQQQQLICRATKSNILSNQIIYFAQPINLFNNPTTEKVDHNIDTVEQVVINSNQNRSFSIYNRSHDNLNEHQQQGPDVSRLGNNDNLEKKKTMCMKNLQKPSIEIQKRRKSISDKLNNSLMNKPSNLNNNLSFYSNQRLAQLEFIRETISLKFKAFKYTFELFQNQMILWPNGKVNIKELKSILSEYPFFLDGGSIEHILGYCSVVQGKDIRVDTFCNKLREFIADYEQLTEQEELILEKKIYKRWKYTKDETLQAMKKNETFPGQITKTKFVSVLEEFKFEQKQIHHLLSQSVAISSDINHIKYRQYLENFLNKK